MFTYFEHSGIVNTVRSQDRTLVALCRDHLESLPGVRSVILRTPVSATALPSPNASLVLDTDVGRLQYIGEVKRRLTAPRLEHALLSLAQGKPRRGKPICRMLLADYIAPALAHRLEEEDVDYVDTAGNLLIRKAGRLHLFKSGAKPQRLREQTAARLPTRSGLQVLFVLLQEPTAASLSYREVAARSGVALGSAGGGLWPSLAGTGHLVRRRDGWQLVGRRALLNSGFLGTRTDSVPSWYSAASSLLNLI